MLTPVARLLVLAQLADSAFPVGGFTLSHGLETAIEVGAVDDLPGVEAFLGTLLRGQLAPLDMAVLIASHRHTASVGLVSEAVAELIRLDRALLARKLGREGREAGRRAGRALLRLAPALGIDDDVAPYADAVRRGEAPALYPVVLGLSTARLGVAPEEAAALYAHAFLLSGLNAAVRLLSIDHVAVQAALRRAAPAVEWAVERAATIDPIADADQLYSSAPWAEILQTRHERSNARSFAT